LCIYDEVSGDVMDELIFVTQLQWCQVIQACEEELCVQSVNESKTLYQWTFWNKGVVRNR